MVHTLIPYVAYKMFAPGDRRFMLGLSMVRESFGLALRFIRCFEGDDTKISIDHITGLFVVHGDNLLDLCGCLPEIRDIYQFDPQRHAPMTDARSPFVRNIEVRDYSPGRKRFDIPRHVLYSNAD
jgi:hypothetical protein